MPEVDVKIGGRLFKVACQEGEQDFLHAAADLLDSEAQVLLDQMGRVPESRMLLMAGLMLADRFAGKEDREREAEAREAALREEIAALKSAPPPEPEQVEIAVLPAGLLDTMSELAARAESLADEVDAKAG